MDFNAVMSEVVKLMAPHQGYPGDVANPPAHVAAVVTYPALALQQHCIYYVYFGYDDDPATGSLTIVSGGRPLFGPIPVTSGGAGFFPISKKGLRNEAMVITLAASGDAAVSGHLSIGNHWSE